MPPTQSFALFSAIVLSLLAALSMPASATDTIASPARSRETVAGKDEPQENAWRTDSVAEKLRLLEATYRSGRRDLARSLAASLKDTLTFEDTDRVRIGPLHVSVEHARPVAELPRAWANWATGWSHYQCATLVESGGLDRVREPVHVRTAVPVGQLTDPWREIRVARVNARTRSLEEVPSQILAHARTPQTHRLEVVFQARVDKNARAQYLMLYGNPNAVLPRYSTDLQARGERYALEIENQYYVARLSTQMGQLERLTYKREHGLELYAGGKGHGEPPTIDWAHDYVDKGHFQKLRMRNWAQCPNFVVIRGPICVRVRRWGFPHSPIHPLFTPSRIHIDQTYTFYPGLPYFFKDGKMEAVKDVEIAAMRDDEWVFSGYSFDETLWIDREGQVHEGQVPGAHASDLWGVGFFHRTSRDAFVALWLEHEGRGFPGIQHGGAPTLHYDGHGQLWSRYPANQAALKAGTVFHQRNAYWMAPYLKEKGREELARLRGRLKQPLEIRGDALRTVADAQASGRLGRQGEAASAGPLKRAIWEALREVKDEQLYNIDANVVDMGYVYDVRVEAGIATITVTMPHRGRPVYNFLVTRGGGRVKEGIQERVRRVDGVREVVVEFTWEPGWTIHRATAKGRKALGI